MSLRFRIFPCFILFIQSTRLIANLKLKEISFHCDTDDRVVRSQPSSRNNSLSSFSTKKEKSFTQPKVMANDDEVANIMAAMQESVRRSWQKTSGSESGT